MAGCIARWVARDTVPDTIAQPPPSPVGDAQADLYSHLSKLIERAGDLLPISGPITAFAFLNTLQALEDLPFDEGMRKGARLYGCHPYLPESRYRGRSPASVMRCMTRR